MRVRLKPLKRQSIVITGAASGIGLTTARMAAARGARVVAVTSERVRRSISRYPTPQPSITSPLIVPIPKFASARG